MTYSGHGYAAVFGWTQMVHSTDGDSGEFETDPIAIYQQIPTPYAWFGRAEPAQEEALTDRTQQAKLERAQ